MSKEKFESDAVNIEPLVARADSWLQPEATPQKSGGPCHGTKNSAPYRIHLRKHRTHGIYSEELYATATFTVVCVVLLIALGTFLQALFTMAAALAIWKSGEASTTNARDDPAWHNALSFVCIAFMSASMGLQGIMGKRVNTQFATTSAFSLVSSRIPR